MPGNGTGGVQAGAPPSRPKSTSRGLLPGWMNQARSCPSGGAYKPLFPFLLN